MNRFIRPGYLCYLAAFAVLQSAPTHAEETDGDKLLDRCLNRYDTVKTYQGTLNGRVQRGDQSTMMVIRVKAVNDPHGAIAQSVMDLEMTSNSKAGTRTIHRHMVDDGHSVFTIDAAGKRYSRQQHTPDHVSGLLRTMLENVRSSAGHPNVVIAQFHGEPVYALVFRAKGHNADIYIHRQNFQLKYFSGSIDMPEGHVSSDLTLTGQYFDRAVPGSDLVWSAPNDYREVAEGEIESPFGKN